MDAVLQYDDNALSRQSDTSNCSSKFKSYYSLLFRIIPYYDLPLSAYVTLNFCECSHLVEWEFGLLSPSDQRYVIRSSQHVHRPHSAIEIYSRILVFKNVHGRLIVQ